MFSKRGWAIVDKVSDDIIDVNFSERACELVIETHRAYEDVAREKGEPKRGFRKKYFAENMKIERIEVRRVRSKR